MHRPDRSCFGRHTHSDAESRLTFFAGFESGFGRSAGGPDGAHRRMFQEYVAKMRADNENLFRDADPRTRKSQRDYVEWKIKEATARFNRGETFYDIKSPSDAHFVAAQLTHRINGDVQDPHMDNAWDTTPQGKKAERDRRTKELHARSDARTNAMLSEFHRSMETGVPPLWQTQYFLEEKMASRQAMIKQWVEEGGMNVPLQLLTQHGLRLNGAAVERINGMPIGGTFVQRSPGNPNAQPGSPVARQALAFPDVAAGLPQKVSERDAKQPGFPMQFYERDPYGGFKLSKDKVLRANTEQELTIRRQQFEQQLAAARQHMQKAFDALQAKVDYAMGPEKVDLLKLQSDMRELVTAAENNTPAWAEFLAKQATEGTLKPGDAQILTRYPVDMQPDMARQLYLSQRLPKSIESIAVRCEAELKQREQLAFNNGQDLHVDFIVKYFVAKGMLEDKGRTTQAQREPAVMQALTALNAYGSHIFRNYRGTIVDDKTRQAFVDAAIANAKKKGLVKSDEEIQTVLITQDDEGIPKLLKMRSDLMNALQYTSDDEMILRPVATSTMEWHLHATRAELSYIEAHKTEPQAKIDPDREPKLRAREAESLTDLQKRLAAETTALIEKLADPATIIAAANKELAFLQTNAPIANRRIAELSTREPDDKLGIIPQQYEKLYRPLCDATYFVAEPKTPDEFRDRLKALKFQGSFLHKYKSHMARSVEEHLPELLIMQHRDTLGLIDATFASIDKNDPVAVGNAVADIATAYVRPLESNAQSKNTAAAARAKLEPKALELRALVNPLVANTRKSAEADAAASIAGIDVALAAINAESRALDVLKLDPARVLALREDMKLLDARVAVRQAEEKKLDVKKDSTPTVDDFRKVDGLLSGEENAIRIVYANDSAALRSRLGEIEKRRAAYGEAIHVAAVAAVDRLNDRSSIADVSNAEGMLRLSLRMRTGIDNPSLPLEELAKRLNSTNEFEQAKQWTDKIAAIRTAATERFVRADAGKPLSEFPTVASETVNGVQRLNLPTGVSGTFALPKGFESAKNVSLFVDGKQASAKDIESDGAIGALFELREEYCQFAVVDGEKGMLKIRNNSFLPLQIRLDGKPVLDVQPLLPKTIGGYAVEVKSYDNLVVSKDGYALTISAHTNPAGYTLWDGSGDGYHIASQSGTSTPVPNEDPLGFFKTLPDAIAALEATLGGKKTVDKMKDWSVRNKETMAKLAAYFNADGSPTKARGWAWEGGSFREEGKNYAVASVDLLRRDENYIRMSRPSDVRYDSETKEYPSVEALIADMPKFLEKKELPPLASVLDRPLKDDDRRILDQRVAEVGDLPTENIIKLLDAAKKIDTTDTWWIDQWTKDVLPRVASKDVRLLRYYAQEYSPRSGGGGYRTTVDAEKVADELVKAKPEDPATLRDAGLALAMLGRKSMVEPLVQKAVPLLEKALDKGDMIAGISLMAINEGTISAMRPYAKKVLELARKEKSDQKLITELEGQLAAWEKMEPETKAEAPKSEPAAANVESAVRLAPGVHELSEEFPTFIPFLADVRQACGDVTYVSYDPATKRCTLKLPENGSDRVDVKGVLRNFGYYWSDEDINEQGSTITLTLSRIGRDKADAGAAGFAPDLVDRQGAPMDREFREFKVAVDAYRRNATADGNRRLEGQTNLFNRKLKQMIDWEFREFAKRHFGQGVEPRHNGISLDTATRTIFLQLKDVTEQSIKAPKSEPAAATPAPASSEVADVGTAVNVPPSAVPAPPAETAPVSLPNAPGQVPVVEKAFEAPIVSRAEIDRLVKIGTSESLAKASKTFFFLVKDFEAGLRVAREQKSGVEQAEAAMRDLAREFNGADGKKGFADIVMESGPNAETEANLRRTHLTLRDYYPPSSAL